MIGSAKFLVLKGDYLILNGNGIVEAIQEEKDFSGWGTTRDARTHVGVRDPGGAA